MDPQVTIVVTPRERFDMAVQALRSIVDESDVPYRLVYVDGGSPRRTRRRLRAMCRAEGFEFIAARAATTPNEARNLGAQLVRTPWTLFVDNDVVVQAGWLGPLLACGEESGAGAVTPLIMHASPAGSIHLAGGLIEWTGDSPNRMFRDEHCRQDEWIDALDPPLSRSQCDFVEFHCCLVRTDVLRSIGGCDEALRSTREHIDFSLSVAAAGRECWFEPDARVTYANPERIRASDVAYYCRRWSDLRTRASLEHFCAKWGVDHSYVYLYSTVFRRDVVFQPIVESARRVGGDRSARRALAVLRLVERVVSRLLWRRPERSRLQELGAA